jgi:two-component system sensor kinase FixL
VDEQTGIGPPAEPLAGEVGEDRFPADSARAAHFRKMYDRVASLARIGVWECELATNALTWTSTVYDLFDIPRGAPLDRAEIVKLYHPDSRAEMERLRAAAIAGGTGFTVDIRIRTPKGNDRWLRLTADVEQEDGRSVRIFGTKQDITAERAAQARVQALQTELIHVSRVSAMSTMAATLAHELNQPLTAVANYMAGARRLMAGTSPHEDLAECLEASGEASLRAGEIIRRLRDMTVRGETSRERLDVAEVVGEAVALATAGDPTIEIVRDLAAAPPVHADRLQVQQVLFNLIRNAAEAAAGGPCRIDVSAHAAAAAGRLEICVADSGPGIAADILPRIFDSLVTSKPQGMGIGLSISRTIVEAHGGHITAANRPEGGARICFTLPLAGA